MILLCSGGGVGGANLFGEVMQPGNKPANPAANSKVPVPYLPYLLLLYF